MLAKRLAVVWSVTVASLLGAGAPRAQASDLVLDWNATLRAAVQHDGTNAVNKANPGWSTRSMAMMNTAIYDVLQAFDRTHAPFVLDATAAAGASREAAVHQAAYELLLHCYGGEASLIGADYAARMAMIADGQAKSDGMALGSQIAAACIAARTGDNADVANPYTPGSLPGQWRPDPYHPDQSAWGPDWGAVQPFAVPGTGALIAALPDVPALTSAEYAAASEQVKTSGEVGSAACSNDQTEIGLFWAYDRPAMGPPPVLFLRNLAEIAEQAGNSEADNARLFAMASVAMADAAIAAWDAKFAADFWRPVTAIHEGDLDGNDLTAGDPTWRPLGAPGTDPFASDDDFTPPFPSWTSGHATMGAALFKTLELFYGTNVFDEIDGVLGDDTFYALTSEEFGVDGLPGMTRTYATFTQAGLLDIGLENSPEGENGTSRIYLGIHWIFDQRDGTTLGRDVAGYVHGHYFQAVPAPGAMTVATLGAFALLLRRKRRA